MRFLILLLIFSGPLNAVRLHAADSPQEEASPEEVAAKALQGIASNLQRNRDGTVRFVRFSKSIVANEHLQHIAAFPRLDFLSVLTPNVDDEGLKHIQNLSNLDTLDLSTSGVTDASASILKEKPKLVWLYFDHTAVTDEILSPLQDHPVLNTLSLRETAVSDAGLKIIGSMKKMQRLTLSGTQVTDAGIKHLLSLDELKILELDQTKITGGSLSEIAKLSKLEVLSLSGTDVTTFDLAKLAQAPSLKTVIALGTSVLGDSLPDLKKSLPKVTFQLSPAPKHKLNAYQRFLAGQELRLPSSTSKPTSSDFAETSNTTKIVARVSERFQETTEVPDFRKHVVPLLGRLGCNGRTCHGSFQGRGGFRLSMFGYDFKSDIEALTQGESPRVDLENPEKSLIIQKPTMQEIHEGGERFELGSWQHRLIRNWIADGAKGVDDPTALTMKLEISPPEIVFKKAGESVRLQATAIWSDGTREDVTPLTRFQSNDDAIASTTENGVVNSLRSGDTHVVAFYDNDVFAVPVILPVSERVGDDYPEVPTPTQIDELVVQKLSKLGVVPSERTTDEAFLRRVSLDIAGTLPTPEEVLAFVSDSSPGKREKKIDELLASPAYVDWWTIRLADLTGSNAQFLGSTDMNTPAANQWVAWLRRRVEENVGWDKIAAGIILADSRRPGQSYADFAAEQSLYLRRQEPEDFYALENPMHYYWFRSNNQTTADRALSFGFVFLGVRLQCAQCHKHPFDRWSQQDFKNFESLFARIKAGVSPSSRETQLQLKNKLGVPEKLDTAALRRQMYLRVSAEGLSIPWNEIWIEPPTEKPQTAQLLGGQPFDLNEFEDPREPLMAWLVSKENPYFAKAMVNRIWSHYFGIGIVDPPDDFNMANPPSNAVLLDWLSEEFIAHGYNLKWLHRTIANSRTYQLSWETNSTNRTDDRNFSHAQIRRLPAEVTVDIIQQATAQTNQNSQYLTGIKNRKITQHPKSIQARGIDYSLLVFGKPLRTTNCDCERQTQPTLLQSLYVRNDKEVLGWLERNDGWLKEVAKEFGETLAPESTSTTAAKPTTQNETSLTSDQLNKLVETSYLRSLSRMPNQKERDRSLQHLKSSESTSEGLRDLMWALVNTQEFLTNH